VTQATGLAVPFSVRGAERLGKCSAASAIQRRSRCSNLRHIYWMIAHRIELDKIVPR
jgi:hypothetical protein